MRPTERFPRFRGAFALMVVAVLTGGLVVGLVADNKSFEDERREAVAQIREECGVGPARYAERYMGTVNDPSEFAALVGTLCVSERALR